MSSAGVLLAYENSAHDFYSSPSWQIMVEISLKSYKVKFEGAATLRITALNANASLSQYTPLCQVLWSHFGEPLFEVISAASFCYQVAALVPHMFYNFYIVKTHKIANNSANTEDREQISKDLNSLEF